MTRQMVRVDDQFFSRWRCSECNWAFSPTGPPIGESLEEMTQNFVSRRDRDFASHVCAEHPRIPGSKQGAGTS
jgi:rubredoxin